MTPASMRAVRNTTDGGPRALTLEHIAPPTRAAGEVLIEVRAAGVAYPDVLQSRSLYQRRFPLPFTLGCEFAGVVVEADPALPDTSAAVAQGGAAGQPHPAAGHPHSATGQPHPAAGHPHSATGRVLMPGDRVAGVAGSGAFADYVVAPADRVLPLPHGLDFVQAAAMPINMLSAEFALNERGTLRAGETVLIHGAAGGLGLSLTQQAKLRGAEVIAVVSTPEKAALARAAGADHIVFAADFLADTRSITAGRGVDMVLDPVGGDRFTDSLRALATRGRLLVLGFTGGSIPTVKVNRLLLTNTTVVGVAWEGLMPVPSVSLPDQWARLRPHLDQGLLRPVITDVVPLSRAAEAVAALDERRSLGKTVVDLTL